MTLPLITVRPIVPESEEFIRSATAEEWEARMIEKYGPDWETRDFAEEEERS